MTDELMPDPSLLPEIEEVIQSWVPVSLDMRDPRIAEVVVPATRAMVAAVPPKTPNAARKRLGAVALLLDLTSRSVGSVSPGVIGPRNVKKLLHDEYKEKSQGWKWGVRNELVCVGRALNPMPWGDKLPSIGQVSFSLPYSAEEEDLLRRGCRLPGASNPAARLWAVSAPIGVGMSGPETLGAETSDVCDLGNGRLVVQVRGRRPRLVPVRECWTDAVSEAVACVNRRGGSSTRFITANGRSATREIARRVPCGIEGGMSLRRARATWVAAHLIADTPLPALKMLAGTLSIQVVYELLSYLDLPLTPMEAVQEGLRA